eukprot:COSAG04_NODE_17748_length_460_cov_0.717452_1_plen_66_part_10
MKAEGCGWVQVDYWWCVWGIGGQGQCLHNRLSGTTVVVLEDRPPILLWCGARPLAHDLPRWVALSD